jgi:hypothetical protein
MARDDDESGSCLGGGLEDALRDPSFGVRSFNNEAGVGLAGSASRQDQTQSQQRLLLQLEEDTQWADQRSKEINQIVKSIVQLNELFRDLSQMVVDQVS